MRGVNKAESVTVDGKQVGCAVQIRIGMNNVQGLEDWVLAGTVLVVQQPNTTLQTLQQAG